MLADRIDVSIGQKSIPHVPGSFDEKYHQIRSEAHHAGVLLRETDEKIDDIITNSRTIGFHAHDVRSNALRLYRYLKQSERLLRCCQWMFILVIMIVLVVLVGKRLAEEWQWERLESKIGYSVDARHRPIHFDHIVSELIEWNLKYDDHSP